MTGRAYRHLVAVATAGLVAAGLLVAPVAAESSSTETVSSSKLIGRSVKDRPIRLYHRRAPGATKRVLVVGGVHGDEPAGTGVVDRLRKFGVPANVDLYLVRTANPDGLAAHRRTNARRVDLNRNFGYRWKHMNVGQPTYSGPRAFSERETRVLRNLVTDVRPMLTVVFHQPLYGVGRSGKRMDVVRSLAAGMRLPVKSFNCSGVCHGTFSAWHNHTVPGVAVTVEFGYSPSGAMLTRAAHTVLRTGREL